jgi:hypothetical protein
MEATAMSLAVAIADPLLSPARQQLAAAIRAVRAATHP